MEVVRPLRAGHQLPGLAVQDPGQYHSSPPPQLVQLAPGQGERRNPGANRGLRGPRSGAHRRGGNPARAGSLAGRLPRRRSVGGRRGVLLQANRRTAGGAHRNRDEPLEPRPETVARAVERTGAVLWNRGGWHMNTACEKARGHLDSYLSRELPEDTSREVQRHLESCPSCAAELDTRARARAQLQAAVRATPVPIGLDAKVRRAVRGEVSRPRTGLWAVAAAAAVILCVVLVGLLRERANPERAILRKTSGRLAAVLNVGLRDHLHCAVFRKD